MKGKIVTIIAVVILVVALGYYFLGREAKAPEVSNTPFSGQVNEPEENMSAAPETATSTQPPAVTSTTPPPESRFSNEDDIQPPPATTPAPTPPPPTQQAPKSVTVSYSGTSFSPASVSIKVGDTVVFKNNSAGNFWPASNPHPTHSAYSGLDAGSAVAAGGTYSFTFTKTGQWSYHNHPNASQGGTVVVTQ